MNKCKYSSYFRLQSPQSDNSFFKILPVCIKCLKICCMNLQDLCVWSFEAQIQEFMLYSGDNPTRPACSALTLPFKKSLLISLQKYFIQPTDKPKHSINIYRRRKHRFAYLFKFGGVVNLCLYLKYKVVAAVDAVFSPFYCACLINIQGAL